MPCTREAVVAEVVSRGGRQDVGMSLPAVPTSRSVPPRTSLSGNATAKVSKPFRAPRTAGANMRAARGGRRSRTTSGGSARTPWLPTDASASHSIPCLPSQESGSHGTPSLPAEASGSRATPCNGAANPRGSRARCRKAAATTLPYNMAFVANKEEHEDVDEEVLCDGSSVISSLTNDKEKAMKFILQDSQAMQQFGAIASMFGMYYYETFMNKSTKRQAEVSGYDWVMTTLNNPISCFNIFRMSRELFLRLHDLLVESYGLKSTKRLTSIESLAMFLWIVDAPQSTRQAENRFERSTETISRKFNEVLNCVYRLSADIMKPKDPEFRIVHPRLRGARFAPYLDNCIGAIDGTHVPVIVPATKLLQYVGRHGYSSQNVLTVCDFDMRFTFAVAGWPRSAHDMRVFTDTLRKYGDKFPHPPAGKFYLVDSGYPNRPGYLAPYRATKYHLPVFRQGPGPSGRKEVFNFIHSSLRNVIERSFGVLKMRWRILLQVPSYPLTTQSKIILACMALHNFIRESAMADVDFDMCDSDENYMPIPAGMAAQSSGGGQADRNEDHSMNAFRDNLADALFAMRA